MKIPTRKEWLERLSEWIEERSFMPQLPPRYSWEFHHYLEHARAGSRTHAAAVALDWYQRCHRGQSVHPCLEAWMRHAMLRFASSPSKDRKRDFGNALNLTADRKAGSHGYSPEQRREAAIIAVDMRDCGEQEKAAVSETVEQTGVEARTVRKAMQELRQERSLGISESTLTEDRWRCLELRAQVERLQAQVNQLQAQVAALIREREQQWGRRTLTLPRAAAREDLKQLTPPIFCKR